MGMAIATESRYWLPDDLDTLPDDGNRYECIDGVLLVTPSPKWTHQRVLRRLLLLIAPYVEAQRVGEAMSSPADIQLNAGDLVQPDLFVVPADVAGRAGREWVDVLALLLAVEVLSPSSARNDRTLKRRYYQRSGVGEYWVVDATSHVVERWRAGDERPEVISETLVWHPAGASEALVINLVELFRDALDR